MHYGSQIGDVAGPFTRLRGGAGKQGIIVGYVKRWLADQLHRHRERARAATERQPSFRAEPTSSFRLPSCRPEFRHPLAERFPCLIRHLAATTDGALDGVDGR